MALKRILYLSFRIPFPLHDGFSLRTFNLGKILSKNFEVDLATLIQDKGQERFSKNLKEAFNNIFCFHHSRVNCLLGTAKALFSSYPLQVGYYFSSEMASWVEKNHANYDIIFCNEIRTARYVERIKNRKCIDFVDAISLNYKRTAEQINVFLKPAYKFESNRLLKYEKKAAQDFSPVRIKKGFIAQFIIQEIT